MAGQGATAAIPTDIPICATTQAMTRAEVPEHLPVG